MLPGQVVSYAQLLEEGFSKDEIRAMSAGLKLFPTPFKGIYYAPMPDEREGWFIGMPLRVIYRALSTYLHSADFYFSCTTAEEHFGIRWQPSGSVHVVDKKRSGRIDLAARERRNSERGTYRAGKIARLLSFYGKEIVFHRTRDMPNAKTKETPYGRFALRSQIAKDKKRFGA